MLLATDIGNTNIVIGGINNDKIIFKARIATDYIKTSDQYGVEIRNILSLFGIKPQNVNGCIISSVVPNVFNSVKSGLIKVINKKPIVVGAGIKTGLNVQTDNPNQIGSDRITVAVGALAKYKPPIILIDFGTATTIDVVEEGNKYIGGCIIPGIKISLDALTSRTAQLPTISLDKPKKIIGKNTVDCMKSGIMYGTACMVEGLIDRFKEELNKDLTVVSTGGLAKFITPLCKRNMNLEKDLLLEGLNIIYKKNI